LKWSIDVLVPFNLIEFSFGNCHLRVRSRQYNTPFSEWGG
jgi:hypothetical protein